MSQDGLVFNTLSDTVLEVRDTISNQQYRIESPEPMEIEPTEYDDFPGPVTDSLTLDVTQLQLPVSYGATARDKDGNATSFLGVHQNVYTRTGTTFVELHTPVKSYLRIDGTFECTITSEDVTYDLSEATSVVLGARVWRRYPTSTITISDSLSDLREAISHFGGEMQTTSPERSFPTLRGHPPKLCVGESLDVPGSVSKPESGITVTVPRDESALLTVAPLAYYLLATVEFGEKFMIQTADGFRYCPPYEDITTAVKSILTSCFFIDCIVRTEGLYPFDLRDRRKFESHSNVELDFEGLYEQSLMERTKTYLQVDSGLLSDITEDWPVTAVIEPGTEATEALPHLVHELAHITPADPPIYTGNQARRHALKTFTQNTNETRSTSLVFDNEDKFVDIPRTESQQTIWVGDGVPLDASKFIIDGYENNIEMAETASIDDNSSSPSNLEITVVCNDGKMAEEVTNIREGWDPREDFPMDLTAYSEVSTDQLRRILRSGTDYFHFIGHSTPEGLRCVDGELDVATIEENNVETFFLNACQSFEQGKRLVKRGSSGGIVTYSDVAGTFALRIGSLVSRLLNNGFPVGTCLSIMRETTPIGRNYTVVGSHAAKIIQPGGGPPFIRQISDSTDGYELEVSTYAAGLVQYAMGSSVQYASDSKDQHHLINSTLVTKTSRDELLESMSTSETPVVYEGELMTKAEFFDRIGE